MTMSLPTPPPNSAQSSTLSTVNAWYAAATNWNIDALANLFDDSYYHKTIPTIADDGIKNKEQALAYVRSISEALEKLPIKVHRGSFFIAVRNNMVSF